MKNIFKVTTLFFLFITGAFATTVNSEHQIRLCDDEKSILKKLNLDKKGFDVENKNFYTYYIETKKRDYNSLGWAIRIRVKSNKTEITVKRKAAPREYLDSKYPNMICEYDLHGPLAEYACKLDANIPTEKFLDVIKKGDNWLNILDSNQYDYLKDGHALFKDAKVFGILDYKRVQWSDSTFGLVTLDLAKIYKNDKYTFHEISIRYPAVGSKEIGAKFNQYVLSSKIKICSNQIDWSVNKFDVMQTY